jgi:hypothetical protein
MGNPAITSVRSVLKLLELNQCIDVEECGGVAEHHLSAAMGAPPQARLAFAAAYEGAQAVAQRGFHETEHRLRKQLPVFPRVGRRHITVDPRNTVCQPLNQIKRKVGRIARHGCKVRSVAMLESRQHPREGSRVVGQFIRPDGKPHGPVLGQITVGIDHDLADLRGEALQSVSHQRNPKMMLQTLVDSTHPAAAPAGKNEPRDVGSRDVHRARMVALPSESGHGAH